VTKTLYWQALIRYICYSTKASFLALINSGRHKSPLTAA